MVDGQRAEGFGELVAEGGLVGIGRRSEEPGRLFRQTVVRAGAGRAAADQVDGEVVREAEQEAPLLAHAVEQPGSGGELDEDLLEGVPRVRGIAGQVHEEACQRIGVVVVQAFQEARGHGRTTGGRAG